MPHNKYALRYFIEFSYNGTNYHGWQIQPSAITVQQVLNEKLSIILKQNIETIGAGRTDAGVHAKQMYAHFDSSSIFDLINIQHRLNSILPKDIAIHQIIPVHDEAHARFDAVSRTYHYFIHSHKNPFNNQLSWYFGLPLDVDKMNEASQILLEHTDFQCFSKVHTDVFTYNCKITEALWQYQNSELIFTISANRFLRNMVRAIVGTLINVGLHKISIDDFINIIDEKDRNKAGFSAPAHGLFLTDIKYPYIKN